MIFLHVNGKTVELNVPDDTPLLWALREELKLTGTKFGCGRGLCGACTVHLEGKAAKSCVLDVRSVQGMKITTIEGLSPDGSHPVQKAWNTLNVPQCGYCQCGQIMAAAALIAQKKKPTESDIELAMSGNLCRCGTYQRIRKAVKLAANNARAAKS